MLKKISAIAAVFALGILSHSDADALLIGGPDIIAAPASVADDAPGAENSNMQAFNEQQGVLLTSLLGVDGGFIGPDILVDSHMIFLNSAGRAFVEDQQTWLFDGNILGVMSDVGGVLEGASNSLLGATGTFYPGAFNNRGLEGNDWYEFSGSQIEVYMRVTEPGDWIRVITEHNPIPEPSTMLLFGAGLAGLAGLNRRKR